MQRQRGSILILASVLLLVTASYVWARWSRFDPAKIGSTLEWLSPASFFLAIILLLSLTVICIRDFPRLFSFLDSQGWIFMLTILALASISRLIMVPATERVYYDEHTYLQLARGIAEEGRAKVSSYGVIEQHGYNCEVGSYPHWPAGWPAFLAGPMRLTGYARWTGPMVNVILSAASILLVVLISVSLFPNTHIWLGAAAAYACLPANHAWSRTSASEVFAVFSAALAVFIAIRFSQSPSYRRGLLFAASVAMASHVRNEAFSIMPICAVFIVFIGGRRALRMAIWPAIFAVILLVPLGLHLGYISRGYQPGIDGAGFDSRYVTRNLGSVAQYVFHKPIVLAVLALALLGVVKSLWRKIGFPLWIWALSVFLIPMFHFGGSYSFPGGERFFLAFLPAVAIGSGVGQYALYKTLARKLPLSVSLMIFFGVFSFALLSSVSDATSEDQKTDIPRKDCAFLKKALEYVSEEGVVITADPPAVIAEGRSAAFITWVTSDIQRFHDLVDRHFAEVYLFIAPSSAPEDWPGGAESRDLLLSAFPAKVVIQQPSPEGLRVLYQLEVRE